MRGHGFVSVERALAKGPRKTPPTWIGPRSATTSIRRMHCPARSRVSYWLHPQCPTLRSPSDAISTTALFILNSGVNTIAYSNAGANPLPCDTQIRNMHAGHGVFSEMLLPLDTRYNATYNFKISDMTWIANQRYFQEVSIN